MRRILVIRYGAFGDIVLCLGAFRAIRAHHPGDQIVALTTAPFAPLLEQSGAVDRVLADRRARWRGWLSLVRRLRAERFHRVYDLQRNQRSAILYRAMRLGRRLEWSGVVRGCSHFVPDDPQDRRHVARKLDEQLRVAGLPGMAEPDISWLKGDVARYRLPHPYALLAAGSAPQRPDKRAAPECFAGLARDLAGRGVAPVLVGTDSEREAIDRVRALCPAAIDLSGRTGFGDLAELARGARAAIGNDTGPMHLFALAGCPSLVLYSTASDPARVAPQGSRVEILQCERLDRLDPPALIAAAARLLDEAPA
jgi:ADP-heptose:LPS heptosyltransferase